MTEKIVAGDGDALLVIHVQNDFLPGGALAVAEGDQVVEPLNRCIEIFHPRGLPIYATRDWHPADHCSFKEQGGPWPAHCVAGSPGAEFAPNLGLPAFAMLISQATDPSKEAYSGFDGTNLDFQLKMYGTKRLFVGGIATDYCVLNTVRDALKLGFQVLLMTDCIRAVNVNPDDGDKAIAEMVSLGAVLITSDVVA